MSFSSIVAVALLLSFSVPAEQNVAPANQKTSSPTKEAAPEFGASMRELSESIKKRCGQSLQSRPVDCVVPADLKPGLEEALSKASGMAVKVE